MKRKRSHACCGGSRYRPLAGFEALEERLALTNLPAGFSETVVASGISQPTSMAVAHDGRVFVTEQTGQVRVVERNTLLATPFVSLSVDSQGERGLLGLAFDPAFATNGFVYVYYTVPGATAHNRVSRFTANGNTAVANSEVVLLELNNLSSATNHNGGALHFGADGKLYIGVGENANSANSQTLGNLLGKMLRINSDGSIPTDNPFFNTATGVNRAIWTLGLRNPFSFGVQPGTGRIFINDVGQNTWEEINDGLAGANYGWPNTEGETSSPQFTSPLFAYAHGNTSTTGCAIVGGAFYNPANAQFPPDYVGDYFFADLCGGWIRRYDAASDQAFDFATNTPASAVDLDVDADGSLLFLSRGSGANTGSIVRFQYLTNVAPLVVAPDQGAQPLVRVMNGATNVERFHFFAYGSDFSGGVRVATADFNADGVQDIVTAAGPGGAPHVRVFNGVNGAELRSFLAYATGFTGGVFVAAGDVNGDGTPDIITGAGAGGGPHVRVFSGVNGAEIRGFFAYAANFTGGVNVAVDDLNQDNRADIVTGAGAGGGPHVRAFSGATGAELRSFMAYATNFTGGVYVAAADINADGRADIVTGAGTSGGPHVRAFNGTNGAELRSFYAFAPSFFGGVRVAAGDFDGDGRAEIIAAAGPAGVTNVRVFRGSNSAELFAFAPFAAIFNGGVFAAGGERLTAGANALSAEQLGLASVALPATTNGDGELDLQADDETDCGCGDHWLAGAASSRRTARTSSAAHDLAMDELFNGTRRLPWWS